MKKNVLLLGASGMLGSMILDVLSQDKSIKLLATVRDQTTLKALSRKYPFVSFLLFDAGKDSLEKIFKTINRVKWVINAIGIIKPFIHDDNEQEVERAIRINAVFPHSLQHIIAGKKINVLQIATDCVYSGSKGSYIETDQPDALDVYGKTKSLGEVPSSDFMHLRASIIGPETNSQNSLLEWFLSQKNNVSLSGFTNHLWNGVTTLHFAKICQGIIKQDKKLSKLQHIVPSDKVNKYTLLKIFAKAFNRKDLKISPIKAPTSVNRSLGTSHDTINRKLWKNAGYKNPPTIEDMVEELAIYIQERSL